MKMKQLATLPFILLSGLSSVWGEWAPYSGGAPIKFPTPQAGQWPPAAHLRLSQPSSD